MTGKFGYADAANGRIEGTQRLFCEMTLKEGRVVWDSNARMAQDYRKLGDKYGIREVDHIVLPQE
jgi:dihydroorotase